MEMTRGNVASTEVAVVLLANPGHDRLEAGQLILEILDGMMQDVQLCSLLSHHLAEVASLTSPG